MLSISDPEACEGEALDVLDPCLVKVDASGGPPEWVLKHRPRRFLASGGKEFKRELIQSLK